MKRLIKGEFGIRVKVAIFVCLVSLFILIIGMGSGTLIGHRILHDTFGFEHMGMADLLSVSVANMLAQGVNTIDIIGDNSFWKEAIQISNSRYKNMDENEIQNYLLYTDKKWIEAFDDDLLIKGYLANRISQDLKTLVKSLENVVEIFITDKRGGLVAASHRTSDFFQADEEWWQKCYAGGKGKVLFENLEYDKSANKLFLLISSPIRDENGDVLGISRTVADIRNFFTPLENFRIKETGHAVLINDKNEIIFHREIEAFSEKYFSEEDAEKLSAMESPWMKTNSPISNKKSFVAWADIQFPVLQESGLLWKICVEQDEKEMFAPLNRLLRRVILIFLLLIFLMIPTALIFGGIFVNPVKKLHEGTERIAAGNLDFKVGTDAADEIGQLSRAFDRMTDDLKKTTTSITKLNEEIAQRKKVEEALREAENQAILATKAKSVFLANMSHEIRTPMNAVLGFTELMLDTKMDEEQIDYTRTIKKSGKALLDLINDILDFSKVEAGEIDIEEIEFDPEILTYDVCKLIQPKIGNKPIELLCHVGDELPSNIRGDSTRIRQVLTNLMGNAVKFTESGEIELSMDVEEESEDKIKIHAAVRDTGIGIPEDKLSTIFEAFQQAQAATTRKYGGTGLGLSISKQIVGLMGGDIWVESEMNKGSTFHVTAWLGKVEGKEVKRIPPVSLSGKKALIVDDNQTNLNLLKGTLEAAGMNVTSVLNTEDVFPTLEKAYSTDKSYDAGLLDIQMPDIDGYTLARQIRDSRSPYSDLPLIAISSLMHRDVHKSEESGFDGFLPKPIQREKLYQMLERVLGKRKQIKKEEVKKTEKIATQYSIREEMKQSVCILLVEDNLINQKLATVMLTKAGYKVEIANNGKEAVDKFMAAPENFDLILMDIQMPKMDGLEAARLLREKEFNSIPIVAMTGEAMKGDMEKCLDAGMNDYVTKPIKRELVFQIIEKWVFEKK